MMHGLILAGGRGSRLAAEGVETPKALVEVAGRPQIVNVVEMLTELGCDSITCMVRDGIPVELPAPAIVRTCRTPSSLHTLVAGLAIVPPGPVFCAMVDTVMPAADWRRVFRGVTERLAARAAALRHAGCQRSDHGNIRYASGRAIARNRRRVRAEHSRTTARLRCGRIAASHACVPAAARRAEGSCRHGRSAPHHRSRSQERSRGGGTVASRERRAMKRLVALYRSPTYSPTVH